jgi:DegV family protein with EDD domain
MEQTVQIVTDSSCDIPQEVLDRLEITVVPLVVRFGMDEYNDGDLTADEFWEKVAGPHHPQTTQPTVVALETAFGDIIARGRHALCLTVTSKLSGTFNAASLAAQRFESGVTVCDSLALSMGLGIQVIAAAEAAQAGRSLDEILSLADDLQQRTEMLIILDTLENLRIGGRADGFISVADRMTQLLNIKPIINVIDGQLRLLRAARSFDRAVRRSIANVVEMGPSDHLAVVHTRQEALAMDVADRLAEKMGFPRERIWVRETGPALSTHAGPGVIGIVTVPK